MRGYPPRNLAAAFLPPRLCPKSCAMRAAWTSEHNNKNKKTRGDRVDIGTAEQKCGDHESRVGSRVSKQCGDREYINYGCLCFCLLLLFVCLFFGWKRQGEPPADRLAFPPAHGSGLPFQAKVRLLPQAFCACWWLPRLSSTRTNKWRPNWAVLRSLAQLLTFRGFNGHYH